jgi:hypothetical protein
MLNAPLRTEGSRAGPRPWCSGTGGFRFDSEHRAASFANDTFGYASKDKSAQPFSSVGRHYNQVDAQSGSRLKNLDCGIARHNEYFIAGSGLEFLMADPFKPNLRRTFGLAGWQRRFGCQRDGGDVKQIQCRIVLPRKLRRNGNRREWVLVEVHRAQNLTKLSHSPLLADYPEDLQGDGLN